MEPIENAYFNWLYAKVVRLNTPTPSLSFVHLFRILHMTEFVWLIQGDENRAEDGLELRYEFLMETNRDPFMQWRYMNGCSVLEMLIAFSRRASFMTGTPAEDWFWEILTNLGLDSFTDGADFTDVDICSLVDPFIWRTYSPGGQDGGMFPLQDPKRDQRKVEVWYQFADYLRDQHRMP